MLMPLKQLESVALIYPELFLEVLYFTFESSRSRLQTKVSRVIFFSLNTVEEALWNFAPDYR